MNVNVAFPGSYPDPVPVTGFMPELPPGFLSTGFLAGLGLFLFNVARADLKAMDTRHREDMKELRDKVDALPSKILELLRAANQPVTPER